ncbi:hypothetical protein JCM19046_4717 [Bacillus sp. JCM 19046]|nr:hypothetical protein JCM19046_4717 [Bacillus sp. JCM 19046]
MILNLHNWNGEGCISAEAYELAKDIRVTLLTMDGFMDTFIALNKKIELFRILFVI